MEEERIRAQLESGATGMKGRATHRPRMGLHTKPSQPMAGFPSLPSIQFVLYCTPYSALLRTVPDQTGQAKETNRHATILIQKSMVMLVLRYL
jgi:hypothetical protein